MLAPDYPLVTARLLVRPYAMDDLDALADLQSREDVARYLLWEPRPRDEVREVLQHRMRQTVLVAEGDALGLAVVLRETNAFVGDLTLVWISSEHRDGEIGYVFHPAYAGRGYATEAAALMLRLAFDELRLHRVVARCDARNRGSVGVMERLGMRREAHFVENELIKGEWTDELVYAMLDAEWPAARERLASRTPAPSGRPDGIRLSAGRSASRPARQGRTRPSGPTG